MTRPTESELHVTGRSRYVADLSLPVGALHAAVCWSGIAHGRLRGIDTAKALAMPGVKAVLTAADIPGQNQIGVVIDDEPLLAESEVMYAGQPLALVVASDEVSAHAAAAVVTAEIDPLPVSLDPRQAQADGELFAPPRTFHCGDPAVVWEQCAHQVEGRIACGGQEQLYLETHSSLAIPRDDGGMLVHASSQSPSGTQAGVARVLGVPMHQVEVDVQRLGGGFGGKESQATPFAAMAALAAARLQRPVRLLLLRRDDMIITGKRHAYQADYRLGIDADGRILAYEVELYQDAGAYTDLSLAVLERSLFHVAGSYRIPHLRATGWSCRTHHAPSTAMRGFGGPQAAYVLEAAIHHLARASNTPAEWIQSASLLEEGDKFPFGMHAKRCRARACWDRAREEYAWAESEAAVETFNRGHRWRKRGIACMPICFGISFTHLPLNQGSALLHIYGDGSVGFSTGAVEMGQGVNRKLQRVAARGLSLPLEWIREESANTTRVANISPSAASVTADLNGKALLKACEQLRGRLLEIAASHLGLPTLKLTLRDGRLYQGNKLLTLSWRELIASAYEQRHSLTVQAHYATPELNFDVSSEQGSPFAYHVYGTAIVKVSLDCLRGIYQVESVQVAHDAGHSLDPEVDRGQVEGGIVQGVGWLTSEELRYAPDGRLLSNSMANYKPPDIHAAPQIEVSFLPQADEPRGLLLAKAVGEPPFLYGIAAWSALQQAMYAFNPGLDTPVDAPLTPERVLMALHPDA